jgi:flagellar assembly protein FliH
MAYKPRQFPLQISGDAKTFVLGQQTQGETDFVISHLVADQVGITDIHRQTLEEQIRAEALVKLKQVQEDAFKEAYDLGLAEGTDKAFNEMHQQFAARLSDMDELLNRMSNILQHVVEQKERQLIDLVFQIGKRLALREISAQPEMIVDLLRQVVTEVQTEDRIVVKVAASDMSVLESFKEKLKLESSKLNNVNVEASEKIQPGGCLLETNQGMIDATIEQRAQKAWETLSTQLPAPRSDSNG